LEDRPRENRKKCQYMSKISFEVDNSEADAIEKLQMFKKWFEETFPKWNESILEYFLYAHGLMQDYDSTKYYLDISLESILVDDTKETNLDKNTPEYIDGKKYNEKNKS